MFAEEGLTVWELRAKKAMTMPAKASRMPTWERYPYSEGYEQVT
jgi:hypothetical protein